MIPVNWRNWTNWDSRITDPKTLIYYVMSTLSMSDAIADGYIETEYNTDKTRKEWLVNLAFCYAANFSVAFEETCALLDCYKWQLETNNLDGDLAAFRGDEAALRQELDKIQKYFDEWVGNMLNNRNALIAQVCKTFNDKEIEQIFKPRFREFLRERLVDNNEKVNRTGSVYNSVKKYGGHQQAQAEIEKSFNEGMEYCEKFLRQAREIFPNPSCNHSKITNNQRGFFEPCGDRHSAVGDPEIEESSRPMFT